MKKPYKGVICRIKPKNKKDRNLRQYVRTLERVITHQANTPEAKQKIHDQIMKKRSVKYAD